MKNKRKYIFVLFLLAIFSSLKLTSAYFITSTDVESIFNTKGYLFKLNSQGGKYNNDDIEVIKGKVNLPTPSKIGYTFLGYSNSANGNVEYSINNNVDDINNMELYAKWQINTYSIIYNLNGGTINNQKTTYNIEESFNLPIPSKTGYSFSGWTGSNGNAKQITVTIPKGTINNLSYNANWNINGYRVDVNPIVDGKTYDSGLSGHTFDVWINGTLVANDVIDWCQNVNYGSTVRVKTNNVTGKNTNFDKTITVGINGSIINPTWNTNSYQVDVNPIIDGTAYNSGKAGYTFSVWVNDNKVATNVLRFF